MNEKPFSFTYALPFNMQHDHQHIEPPTTLSTRYPFNRSRVYVKRNLHQNGSLSDVTEHLSVKKSISFKRLS